jgi:hypothetical protein
MRDTVRSAESAQSDANISALGETQPSLAITNQSMAGRESIPAVIHSQKMQARP